MDGKQPKRVISINLSAMTFYLSLTLMVITIAGSLYAGVTKLGRMQAESVLKPVVRECVSDEVSRQLAAADSRTARQLAEIKMMIESVSSATKAVSNETRRNTKMLEILLEDRLHRNGGGDR